MTTALVVQARMGSSRLPGKVLRDLTEGEPVLARVVERLRRATTVDHLIIATTLDAGDDAIVRWCGSHDVECYRGDTFDVLARYAGAIAPYPDVDLVVRVTADCPFVDPETVDTLVELVERGGVDYASNRLPPPYARTYPVGLDVEVFTRAALASAAENATQQHQREHVTPYLYEDPDAFSLSVIDLPTDLSHHRWTIDTPEDMIVARAIAEAVGPEPFGWRAVLDAVTANPELESANRGQVQKLVTEVDDRATSREDGS